MFWLIFSFPSSLLQLMLFFFELIILIIFCYLCGFISNWYQGTLLPMWLRHYIDTWSDFVEHFYEHFPDCRHNFMLCTITVESIKKPLIHHYSFINEDNNQNIFVLCTITNVWITLQIAITLSILLVNSTGFVLITVFIDSRVIDRHPWAEFIVNIA